MNCGSLVLAYTVYGILYLILKRYLENKDHHLAKRMKESFEYSFYTYFFINTVQEEFMLALL